MRRRRRCPRRVAVAGEDDGTRGRVARGKVLADDLRQPPQLRRVVRSVPRRAEGAIRLCSPCQRMPR
jgi:hypothetical protein